MNTLTLALMSAFAALDSASEDLMCDTVVNLIDLVTENRIDDWVADYAVDAVEREVEIRTGTLLDDGHPIDQFDGVSNAIARYRNS